MNALTKTLTAPSTTTMSSLEIAELTGKRHDNVMRDIREVLESLGKDGLSFEDIYLDAYRREKPYYRLPKDLVFTLVTGYSVPLRHKVVTRWMELEAAAMAGAPAPAQTTFVLPNFSDPAAAARAWAAEYEEKTQATAALAIAAPKAALVDRTFKAENAVSVRDYMKKYENVHLGKVSGVLCDLGHCFKDAHGRLRVRRSSTDYFVERWVPGHSIIRVYSCVVVTPEGAALLDTLYAAGKFPLKKGRTLS